MAGYLLDIVWAPALACVLQMMPAISMYIFTLPDPTYAQMVTGIVVLGVAAGVEYDLLAYWWRDTSVCAVTLEFTARCTLLALAPLRSCDLRLHLWADRQL